MPNKQPKIFIFYQESKPFDGLAKCTFGLCAKDLKTWNGLLDLASSEELERRVLELIRLNVGVCVHNRIPFVNDPYATFYELTLPDRRQIYRYRPLMREEIPSRLLNYIV